MLVLSRKIGEQIVIGEGERAVRLTVVEIRGDKVRLAFVAPKDVRIDRLETHEARKKANQQEG